jgi:preprotein translocase subunit Sss1
VRSLQRLEFVAEPLSRILVAELTGFTVIGAIGLQAYLLHLPYSFVTYPCS